MKIVTIEQIENGGSTKIVEEIIDGEKKEVYNSNYLNALTILGDLRKFAFSENDILSKQIDGDKIILKGKNSTIINLVNFSHPILKEEIDKKIYKSFKNFLDIMNNCKYDSIYLTAQKNRFNFNFISSSPHSKDDITAFFELELDETGELTHLSKLILDEILQRELRNWVRVFISDDSSNVLRVYYDDKTLMVNPNLIKYVKAEVDKMEDIYLQSIENINKERGI